MAGAGELWAVLPVKPLAEGKSRLALPPAERIACNRFFFRHALAVLARSVGTGRVVVVSRDPEVLDAGRAAGAHALPEKAGGDLNAAMTAGAILAARHGAGAVLTIAADLPGLTVEDIAHLVAARTDAGTIAIAPDAAGAGTNALLMAPLAMPYRYGANSFWAHLEVAQAGGHGFAVVRTPGLAEDVDWPADLARAVARGVVGGG
jgi:2-phospho-L-lactate guanylyltransferase